MLHTELCCVTGFSVEAFTFKEGKPQTQKGKGNWFLHVLCTAAWLVTDLKKSPKLDPSSKFPCGAYNQGENFKGCVELSPDWHPTKTLDSLSSFPYESKGEFDICS